MTYIIWPVTGFSLSRIRLLSFGHLLRHRILREIHLVCFLLAAQDGLHGTVQISFLFAAAASWARSCLMVGYLAQRYFTDLPDKRSGYRGAGRLPSTSSAAGSSGKGSPRGARCLRITINV